MPANWERSQPKESIDIDEGLHKLVVPSLREEAKELQALAPPAEDKPAFSNVIALLSKGSEVIEEAGRRGITRSGLDDFERKAAAFGLRECSGL